MPAQIKSNTLLFLLNLFPRLLVLQEQPYGARQQDGGISAAATAYQHGEGEIMDGLPAEEEDGHNGKQRSDCRINGPRQGGLDAVVDHVRHRLAAAVHLQVLTDAVKNNDSAVDRVTYNRQQRGHKGGVDLQLQQGEPAQGHRHGTGW